MTIEKTDIDEKYTYQFDNGRVQILRHGQPWLDSRDDTLTGSQAWIAAANRIQELEAQVAKLTEELIDAQLRTACEECNAEPGEACRPYCTSNPEI